MHPFSPKLPSHPDCHITLSGVPLLCVGPSWLPILNTAQTRLIVKVERVSQSNSVDSLFAAGESSCRIRTLTNTHSIWKHSRHWLSISYTLGVVSKPHWALKGGWCFSETGKQSHGNNSSQSHWQGRGSTETGTLAGLPAEPLQSPPPRALSPHLQSWKGMDGSKYSNSGGIAMLRCLQLFACQK